MTPAASFSGRAVALFGLGGSGLSTARALMAGGAHVAAWEFQGEGQTPLRNTEPLNYETVKMSVRSYK